MTSLARDIDQFSSQSNQAEIGQPEFIFSPFEELHLNLNYRPNLVDADDITGRCENFFAKIEIFENFEKFCSVSQPMKSSFPVLLRATRWR